MTISSTKPRRLVADRRRGVLLGVCRGLADHGDTPVVLVRLAAILLVVAGLGLPGVVAYVVIAWLASGTTGPRA